MVERPSDEPSGSPAWSVLPDAPTISEGRYAVVAKIAEGGMAGVYRAWDTKLEVWRAIKVVLPEYAKRQSLRRRFETEAETMAKLDHPNIIRVYDVGAAGPLPYMVMELAEGGTLDGWVDAHGPMPPRLACDVIEEVARGLGAAHAAGVVHRDIKPQNVLVTSTGVCKVADFGIARILELDGFTRTGSTMGTIGYMSPEQRSDAKIVDARADVYALGAMLFKLATGTLATDLYVAEFEPSVLDPLPEPFREVVLRACAHDREQRYPSSDALVGALLEVRARFPPDPADTPPLARPFEEATPAGETARFPELAELFAPLTAESSAPTPEEPSGEVQLLPYTMPHRTPRTVRQPDPAPTPIWVQRAPLSVPPSMPSMDGAVSDGTPTMDDRSVVAPERVPAHPVGPWMMRAAIAAWIAVGVALIWGTVSVRDSASDAALARAELYRVLEVERDVLGDLAQAGVPHDRLQPLGERYASFVAAASEPGREAAATAYATAVRVETAALLGRGAPPGLGRDQGSTLASARARNIESAWVRWTESRDAWSSSARRPLGRLAVRLGAAPAPP